MKIQKHNYTDLIEDTEPLFDTDISPELFNDNHQSLSDMFAGLDDDIFEIVPTTSLEDNAISETPETPAPGVDTDISSVLMALIKDEYEAIDGYNNSIATIIAEGNNEYKNIIAILKDIANEENIHVGQLQAALKLVSPNAASINKGEQEAVEEQNITANELHPGMAVEEHVPGSVAPVNSAADTVSGDDICLVGDVDDTF